MFISWWCFLAPHFHWDLWRIIVLLQWEFEKIMLKPSKKVTLFEGVQRAFFNSHCSKTMISPMEMRCQKASPWYKHVANTNVFTKTNITMNMKIDEHAGPISRPFGCFVGLMDDSLLQRKNFGCQVGILGGYTYKEVMVGGWSLRLIYVVTTLTGTHYTQPQKWKSLSTNW